MRYARCDWCGKITNVNKQTQSGVVTGEYCEECFDQIDHDEPKRHQWSSDSGPNHNDPGFDNVIRAYEEDR